MRRVVKGTVIALGLIGAAAGVWYAAGDRLLALAGGDGPPGDRAGGPPAVPVEVAEVRRGEVRVTVETTGELEARERTEVTTDAQGLVRRVVFDEGEPVEQGEALVRLDAEEEQARLEAARARRERIAIDLRRARDLAEENFETEARIDELEAELAQAEAEIAIARAELDERTIEAPFSGWIGLRMVSPGALVEPGTPIAQLWSIDPIELAFEVPGHLAPRLEAGQQVIARSRTLPEGRVSGRVETIEDALADPTRTIALEATLANPEGRLRPGTFVTVELVLATRQDALLVPEEALLLRGSEAYVYVLQDDQTVARRQVDVGERRLGEAEIVEGLDGNEQVVVAGLQTISDGQKVRPVSSSGGTGRGAGAS